MRLLPPFEQVYPTFRNTFETVLTRTAKAALISALALPVLGAIFSAPLLLATHFGNDREAEENMLVKYGFSPLAMIGVGFCMGGLLAVGTLALSILADLTHTLMFRRHAMSYHYVFFPFKFDFIDYKALIK